MINGQKIVLRDKRLADAKDDYAWRTDAELAQLDAAPQVTVNFPEFLLDYISELRCSNLIRRSFAIETKDGKHIGNCGYYGVDEAKGEAETGITIGNRDYWDNGYGTDAMATLVDYIFRQTNLSRIYLKSLDWNTRAHRCFQKCGFVQYGHLVRDGFNFMLMEIHRKQWQPRQTEV